MKALLIIENQKNIDISIQLINDISVYAKRISMATLETGSVITDSVSHNDFADFPLGYNIDAINRDYLDKIADLVEQFGRGVDQAISVETGAIRRKEDLSKFKLLRRIISDWQPLGMFTNGWITALYESFHMRIDQLSKSYLNQLVEKIQFMEVNNE